MKTLRFFLSGLLTITVGLLVATAESNPPAPSSGKEIQAIQSKTESDKAKANIPERGSVVVPIAVQSKEPEHPQKAPEKDKKESTKESRNEWWIDAELRIAQLTAGLLLIAFVQFLAFVVQLELMRRGLKDTSDTAKSGQASVKVAIDTARKQLRAYVGPMTEPKDGVPSLKPNSFIYRVSNFGETPAFKFESRAAWITFPGENAPWPAGVLRPDYGVAAGSLMALFPGSEPVISHTFGADQAGVPFATSRQRALNKEITMYIFGTLNYADIYGEGWRTNFCFRLKPGDPAHLEVTDFFNDAT